MKLKIILSYKVRARTHAHSHKTKYIFYSFVFKHNFEESSRKESSY